MSKIVSRFAQDRSASILIFGPALFLAVIGFTSLAVDGGNLYYTKLKLQKIADAAATGAVFYLPNADDVSNAALRLVSKNSPSSFGNVSRPADVQIGIWDPSSRTFTPSSTQQNAVKVITHRSAQNGNPVPTYFARLFNLEFANVNAASVAVLHGNSKCVYILDNSASNAFSGSGAASVSTNCGIQINSTAKFAASMNGSSSISAPVCVTGGYKGNGWNPAPRSGPAACPQSSDPLATLAEPQVPASCTTLYGASGPGCYTGSVKLSGTINLSPGLYYLKNSKVTCTAGTTISGSGVQIFLDANSTLDLTGSGDVMLSASSAQNGIVIRASRSNTGNAIALGGNGALSLNGTIYAPASTMSLGGNSSYNGKTGYVIVNQLSFGGSAQFSLNSFGTSAINFGGLLMRSALTQ